MEITPEYMTVKRLRDELAKAPDNQLILVQRSVDGGYIAFALNYVQPHGHPTGCFVLHVQPEDEIARGRNAKSQAV